MRCLSSAETIGSILPVFLFGLKSNWVTSENPSYFNSWTDLFVMSMGSFAGFPSEVNTKFYAGIISSGSCKLDPSGLK